MSRPRPANADRRLLLTLGGVALVLIAGITIFSPGRTSNDPQPTTTNNAPGGARAAYLALSQMGLHSTRWIKSLDDLRSVDAAQTTLILAQPVYNQSDRKAHTAAVQRFLERGGRVLTTGTSGAFLLPDGAASMPSIFQKGLCYTVPQNAGPLAAQTGQAELYHQARWTGTSPAAVADQRCGPDVAAVHFAVGKGTAVWWSSATPLSNTGLKTPANLRLFLAALDNRPNILWDESLQSTTPSHWASTHRWLIIALIAQAVAAFVLLILSFSRRNGPVRQRVQFPRTSPTEFAESMGALYARADITAAATDAARHRLLRLLRHDAGLPLSNSSEAIAEALSARLPGDWTALASHLAQAAEANLQPLSTRSALLLVQALHEDESRLHQALHPTGG